MKRLLAAALFPCLVTPLLGQAPAQTDTTITSYYAALRAETPTRLQMLAERGDPTRRALAAAELTSRISNMPNSTRAVRLGLEATKRDSLNAWAHLALARALQHSDQAAVLKTLGYRSRSVAALAEMEMRRAVALQPTLPDAPEVLETYASAKAQRTVSAKSRAPLTEAISLFRAGNESAGEGAYWKGVETWDSATANAYLDDVRPILNDESEEVSLAVGDLQHRAEALHHFWKKRALRAGISIGARIGEQYRRLDYARKNYWSTASETHLNVFGKRRKGIEGEVDDRGLIYLRFGEPDQKAVMAPAMYGNEAWGYRFDGNIMTSYYFSAGILAANPVGIFGSDVLSRFNQRYAFVEARNETIRLYKFMSQIQDAGGLAYVNRGMRANAAAQADMLQRLAYWNRVAIFEAFEKDAAKPYFARSMTAFHDFATFKGDGCTDVVHSFAAVAPYFRATVAVVDTFSWEAVMADTLVSAANVAGGIARSTGTLCIKPDYNAYVRYTIAQDTIAGAVGGEEMHVPDYSGRDLMISDVLFAALQPGPFVRGTAQLAIVPSRAFRQHEPFRIFYEIYNLPRGRKYKTEIAFKSVEWNPIIKLFKGRASTSVTFEGESESEGVAQVLRTYVPDISPGEVDVTITVTDLTTGAKASSKERIRIIPE